MTTAFYVIKTYQSVFERRMRTLQFRSPGIAPGNADESAPSTDLERHRVTWGKAPPPPGQSAPPPLSNYEFTHASGSISCIAMHHVGKVFMSQKN